MARPSNRADRALQLALAPLLLACATFAATLSGAAPSAAAPAPAAWSAKSAARRHSLLQSRELWATVDVCNPADQRDTVGVRGSMPSDGHLHDAMYMSFQLQYLQADGSWVNLTHGGSSGFIAVGAAKGARQGGTSFQIMPVKGQPAYALRGLVTFQWRRGAKVLHEVTRATTASHRGVADADPPGYSAAQCTIG